MRILDLNSCNDPTAVVTMLRQAAEDYAADGGDLEASHQIKRSAWSDMAKELDRTADRIVRMLGKRYPEWATTPHTHQNCKYLGNGLWDCGHDDQH